MWGVLRCKGSKKSCATLSFDVRSPKTQKKTKKNSQKKRENGRRREIERMKKRRPHTWRVLSAYVKQAFMRLRPNIMTLTLIKAPRSFAHQRILCVLKLIDLYHWNDLHTFCTLLKSKDHIIHQHTYTRLYTMHILGITLKNNTLQL